MDTIENNSIARAGYWNMHSLEADFEHLLTELCSAVTAILQYGALLFLAFFIFALTAHVITNIMESKHSGRATTNIPNGQKTVPPSGF